MRLKMAPVTAPFVCADGIPAAIDPGTGQCGAEQFDDITMLGFAYNGPGPHGPGPAV